MYYRVAILRGQSPRWQWKSTVLSSLDTLFRFIRLYCVSPQHQLHIFSSNSRQDLNAQLACKNNGLECHSVTAAQFLQERLIIIPGISATSLAHEAQMKASICLAAKPSLDKSSMAKSVPNVGSRSVLDIRRREIENGTGGDHDVSYTFALPRSSTQVLAWARLLVKVQAGTLQL